MPWIILKTIVIFSLLLLPFGANGQNLSQFYFSDEYIQVNYLTSINNINKDLLNNEEVMESPLRRFEVAFFISLPFVFLANFLTLHVYEVIKQQDFNVSVWKEHKKLLIGGTIAIPSLIAFREAMVVRDNNKTIRAGNSGEQTFFFCFTRSY